MKRIGIIGGRDFTDYHLMKSEFFKRYAVSDVECIYSGGAKGADSLAKDLANELEIEIVEILPDWEKYGKSAGFVRNIVIVASSDEILAFWDGVSKGTNHSINLANKKGTLVHVVKY